MAEKVSNIIPVAERIIQFKEEDYRKNPAIVYFSEDLISDKEWENFAENALVIMDGWHIEQYAEEYPIVKYKCDKSASCYLEPDFRLNSFIESITVSTALYGKRVGVGTGRISSENVDFETVIYYTDHAGICHSVIQHDICWFLLHKPNLVVSPEGMLIFFTEKEILATVDCNHYHWISGNILDIGEHTIKDIVVCEDYCQIILLDDQKDEYNYSLKFDYDITEYQMIYPKILKL